jgi:hypothetical protein
MAAAPIDYAALADQARHSAPKVDYAALAQQARTGGVDDPVAGAGPMGTPQPAAHPAVNMQSSVLSPSLYGNRLLDNAKGLVNPLLHIPSQIASYPGLKQGLPFVDPSKQGGPIQTILNNPDKGEGVANALTDTGTALALGKAIEAAAGIPSKLKSAVVGDINKPIPGTNTTPSQQYQSAQKLGVNLDAADATNSPFFKMTKVVNQHSLLGAGSYEKMNAANTSALQDSTDGFLYKMHAGDRESGGAAIQKQLKANQTGLYDSAQKGFDSLPQDVPVPGLAEVGKTAQGIAATNADYQGMFPSLRPNKAMGVVGDVGGLGPKPPAPVRMSPFFDESGNPIASSSQAEPQQPQNFSTGQKLRSDLLDFTRNNPDIVQNQGNGFIQRLAGDTDNALTDASGALTPSQLNTFRSANANWKDMKATYDDPSNPLYHAVRTDNPSSLYSGIGAKTPENARNLLGRLTPAGVAPGNAPAVGAIRRGTIESALKTNNDGSPNFKTFGTQLNRIPADYRAELFSPDQNVTLQDISRTSNVLNKDSNPSGSAKLGQKVIEGSALAGGIVHPLGAVEPLLQYPIARLMNSPAAVDWLMKQKLPTSNNPLLRGIAIGAPATQLGKPIGSGGRK